MLREGNVVTDGQLIIDIDPNAHAWNEGVVTDPTCEDKGYTTYTCTLCETTRTDDEVEATGHSYNEVVTAPTCYAEGYTTYTCSACSDTYTANQTAKIAHTMRDGKCTADGCDYTFGSKETATYTPSSYFASNSTSIDKTISNVTFAFAKNTGSTAPQYYSNGTAIRAYGGNTITITAPSEKKITNVVFTFGSSDGSNAITTDGGTYSDGTWTGEANSVKFTIGGTSGNRRIASITVTYEQACTHAELTNEVEQFNTTNHKARCAICGFMVEVAHTPETITGTPATCTSTGLGEGEKCSVCDQIIVAQETIAMIPHNYTDHVCTVCGADEPTYTVTVNAPDGITWEFASEKLVEGTTNKFYGNASIVMVINGVASNKKAVVACGEDSTPSDDNQYSFLLIAEDVTLTITLVDAECSHEWGEVELHDDDDHKKQCVKCSEVSYEAHNHTTVEKIDGDDVQHNLKCACGHAIKEDHNFEGGTCSKCGYEEPAAEPQWVKTELADIKSDDIVVIAWKNSSNERYALTNGGGTSSAPKATKIAVSGDVLTETIAENLMWNISNSSGNLTIYPNGKTNVWLYCTSTNNGVRVGTNTSKTFIIDSSSGYLKHSGTNRYLGVYNRQDVRCYTNTTGNTANQVIEFYVYK